MNAIPTGPWCWNTGALYMARPAGTDVGFSPEWMTDHECPPTFELTPQLYPVVNNNDQKRIVEYYHDGLLAAQMQGLPIAFEINNIAAMFKVNQRGRWWNLAIAAPEDSHPFQIELNPDGTKKLNKQLCSPFSPGVASWRELGELYGTYIAQFQSHYPDPPQVLILDNNELAIPSASQLLLDYRCPQFYKTLQASLHPFEFKSLIERRIEESTRKWYADWLDGVRSKLSTWKNKVQLVGYRGLNREFCRSDSIAFNERINVCEAFPHGGSSDPVGYLRGGVFADIVRNPMVNACNVKFHRDEYERQYHTRFYHETMFAWPVDDSKIDDAQFLGMVRGTMWICRSDAIRFYTDGTKTIAQDGHKFQALVDAKNELVSKPILNQFWRHGTLLQNRWLDSTAQPKFSGFGHPYNAGNRFGLPPSYPASTLADRWFIQPTSADQRTLPNKDNWSEPFNGTAPVNVLAICFEHEGEYLVYATAPRGAKSGVTISPCPDGPTPRFSIVVDVPIEGVFWHVVGGVPTEIE